MFIWLTDADSIEFNDNFLDITYKNNSVSNYLNEMRFLGISGIKGQGKTFLLKAKRKLLQNKDDGICLPVNIMTDTLDSALRIGHNMKRFLSSYTNWVGLWKTAISITILQNNDIKQQYNSKDFKSLSEYTIELLNVYNEKCKPSIILYSLLNKNQRDINMILKDTTTLLNLLSRIHSGVYLFIDKVDQAFASDIYEIIGDSSSAIGSRNASIWQYCQYALANASNDIYCNINNHIKVYYSIRQEALLDSYRFACNVSRNIEARIINLDYTKRDLYGMFKLYIQNADDADLCYPEEKYKNPGIAYFGIDKIKHSYVKEYEERLFDYIYRHTVMRPYDIVKICYQLDDKREKGGILDQDYVKNIVESTASEILEQYISEVEPFINVNLEVIYLLLSCLGTNIFDKNYMRLACEKYMLIRGKNEACCMNCSECEELRPFYWLYNIGLLGYLHKKADRDENVMKYLDLGKRVITNHTVELPQSPLYFLHPCLHDIAFAVRIKEHKKFVSSKLFVVGSEYQCSDEAIHIIQNNVKEHTKSFQYEKVFVSSTIDNMYSYRNIAREVLIEKGYTPILSEYSDFMYGLKNVFSHDHCIDEILKCRNFISIIGARYGGIYNGQTYSKYAEEIKEYSNGLITEPSISLMEYYVARKKGLNYCVLVDNAVINYKKNIYTFGRDNINYSKSELDKVITMLNFINHLAIDGDDVPRGNWYYIFGDEEDYRTALSNIRFEDTGSVSTEAKREPMTV